MKYRDCWNNHGQSICEHFQCEHNLNIQYTTDYEQLGKYERVHFIIVMDQTSAMGREKFDQAKNGVVRFLSQAHEVAQRSNLDDHAVSIILYGADASTVVKQKPLQDQAGVQAT